MNAKHDQCKRHDLFDLLMPLARKTASSLHFTRIVRLAEGILLPLETVVVHEGSG